MMVMVMVMMTNVKQQWHIHHRKEPSNDSKLSFTIYHSHLFLISNFHRDNNSALFFHILFWIWCYAYEDSLCVFFSCCVVFSLSICYFFQFIISNQFRKCPVKCSLLVRSIDERSKFNFLDTRQKFQTETFFSLLCLRSLHKV